MSSKITVGIIHSIKMQKTITVRVLRTEKHSRYNKSFSRHTNFQVHVPDESLKLEVGQMVSFVEVAPISKTKKWQLVDIIS